MSDKEKPAEQKAVGSKLKEFIESRKREKSPAKVFYVESKENVKCPDCGQTVFKDNKMSGCICVGENKDSKIFIKKSEKGIQVRFSKDWDAENIAILLETFRNRKRDL